MEGSGFPVPLVVVVASAAECLHLLVSVPLARAGAQAIGAPSVSSILQFAEISAKENACGTLEVIYGTRLRSRYLSISA